MRLKNKKLFSLIFLGIITLSFVLAPLPFLGENIAHAQAQQPQPSGPPVPTALRCSTEGWGLDAWTCVGEGLLEWIGALALSIFGAILGLAGILLNEVMSITIVKMADNLQPLLAQGGGIYQTWTTLRDLANMLFIFIILYIAIATILQLENINTKKLLVHVIIVALLLNFSLFFTKIIIDASNIITTSFYNDLQVTGGVLGLSEALMKPMGLSGIFDITGAKAVLNNAQSFAGMFFLGVFGSLLFLVATFVFFATSVMLVSRFVILIFLMILSPLAFIAMALPKDDYWKKWWHSLMTQALFAPILLALLWATVAILNSIMAPVTGTSLAKVAANAVSGGGDNITSGGIKLILNFMVVIGSVIFALVAAREISGAGASGIMKWGKKAAGTALGYIPGRSAAWADKKFLKDTRFGQTMLGSAIRAPLGGIAKAKILGGKSGKDIQEIKEEQVKKYAAAKTKSELKKAEKIATKKSEDSVANLEPIQTVLEQKFKRESAIIQTDKDTALGATERNYTQEIERIKTDERAAIRAAKAAFPVSLFNRTNRNRLKLEIEGIKHRSGEMKQRTEERKATENLDTEREATRQETRAGASLAYIKTKVDKVKKDVYKSTRDQQVAKSINELEKMRSFKLYLTGQKKRKEAAKFLKEGKTSAKTDMEKLVDEMKKVNKNGGGDKH